MVSAPGYRADRRQAKLVVRHTIGFIERSYEGWKGPTPTRPDGERPGRFEEVLVLEQGDEGWRLVERMDSRLPEPPWLVEKQTRERLQNELGEWGQVVKIVADGETIREVLVHTPEGPFRVIAADALHSLTEPLICLEPTLWVLEPQVTGRAIREAFGNPVN